MGDVREERGQDVTDFDHEFPELLIVLALVRGTFGGAEISLAMLLVSGMLGRYLLLDPVIGLALAVLATPLLGAAEVVARQPVTTVDLSRDYLDFDKGSDQAMF